MASFEARSVIDRLCQFYYDNYNQEVSYWSYQENLTEYLTHLVKFNTFCYQHNMPHIVGFQFLKFTFPCCPNVWYDQLKQVGYPVFDSQYKHLELYSTEQAVFYMKLTS